MYEKNEFTLGLIINPIAGMGGAVGLKGTDGRDILKKAISLGAQPTALNRTKELLEELNPIKQKIKFYTCPSYMGEIVLKEMQLDHEILSHPLFEDIHSMYDTTSEHTKKAAEIIKKKKEVKLLLFVGGDGTARDILDVIDEQLPCLGIPAGVKIYSGVFSLNPKVGASIILQYLWDELPLRESEVLDIDENEYRKGNLKVKSHGYLLVPNAPDYSQDSKMGTPATDLNNQERIAKMIVEILEKDTYYLLGPGTTTKAITDELHQEKTILGVDLLVNKKIVASDLNEQEILNYVNDGEVKIILSPIGRQGFILGRGNLQFTPKILKKVGPKNLIIISTKYKLNSIQNQVLRVDTRDSVLDEEFRGLYRVITDYMEFRICEVK